MGSSVGALREQHGAGQPERDWKVKRYCCRNTCRVHIVIATAVAVAASITTALV